MIGGGHRKPSSRLTAEIHPVSGWEEAASVDSKEDGWSPAVRTGTIRPSPQDTPAREPPFQPGVPTCSRSVSKHARPETVGLGPLSAGLRTGEPSGLTGNPRPVKGGKLNRLPMILVSSRVAGEPRWGVPVSASSPGVPGSGRARSAPGVRPWKRVTPSSPPGPPLAISAIPVSCLLSRVSCLVALFLAGLPLQSRRSPLPCGLGVVSPGIEGWVRGLVSCVHCSGGSVSA
jgi:hypothetical protein